ncbi:MerR family transcriptional regulator [Knoellia subterranea]|uniref:Transcriptional regulator n=1 Tax=Knoellia subterranea KCTC 19937 TaxID=1385521 RepID=A0A0A0JK41_9MICO|nr:MerR family transcriptional regulator [Knoellia subterranea]KGN37119.1 transcriptional regulator [Knoellia subterranea KCTC 19937]
MYTIKKAAELTGIGLSTLRAWERRYGIVSPVRSSGGYRLYSDVDVRALAIMTSLVHDGWTASEAAAETLRRVDGARPSGSRPGAPGDVAGESSKVAVDVVGAPEGLDDLISAAQDMDVVRVGSLLDHAFGSGRDFLDTTGRWLMPALVGVGDAWADGRLGVAGEHLVSNAVQRRLSTLYENAPRANTGPLALVGLPPGARHELGLLSFAVAARRSGLATAYVGADLPGEDWARALSAHAAGAAVIAVPRLADVVPAQTVVDRLRQETPSTVVAVGGRHQDEVKGALRLGHDFASAVEVLRSALASHRRAPERTPPLAGQ